MRAKYGRANHISARNKTTKILHFKRQPPDEGMIKLNFQL